MKVVFYYDNGKSYTATNVTHVTEISNKIYYETKKRMSHYTVESTFTVDSDNVIAYKVDRGHKVEVRKLKPCAVIKTEVCRKKVRDMDNKPYHFWRKLNE